MKKPKGRAAQLAERLKAQRLKKGYAIKPNVKFYGGGLPSEPEPDADGLPHEDLNRIYVTKEELEATHNSPEEPLDVTELRRVLESKKDESTHYSTTHDSESDLRNVPPRNAEYLVYFFLERIDREILLGDLAEEYPSILAKFGRRKAQVYFYKQIIWSIWPLVRKALIKWAAFGWVADLIRRISS